MSTVGSGAGFAELGAYIEMKGCFLLYLLKRFNKFKKIVYCSINVKIKLN